MLRIYRTFIFMVIIALISPSLHSYPFLLEFKGAYFLPTGNVFNKIYHNAAIFGPEVTFAIHNDWYGFASADFLSTKGRSINFHNRTTVTLIDVAVGFKYFVPFRYGNFYAGLGVLPTQVHTRDHSPFVIPKRTKWGCGGIGKMGAYFDLPQCFVINIFFEYSFVNISFKHHFNAITQSHKANLNGCRFGAGLGYQF